LPPTRVQAKLNPSLSAKAKSPQPMLSAVMIYSNIPSFDELMTFAELMEKEFNKWVASL
jgi:hypothetical protein